MDTFLQLRDLEGLTEQWYKQCKGWLLDYLNFVEWKIDQSKTLDYCKLIKDRYSLTYYRKIIFQIRKFLEYLKVDFASSIKLPPEPHYQPKRVTSESITELLQHYQNHPYFKQIKALILLGSTSGLRAEELFQLREEDLDLKECIVKVNHNPANGQTVKTGKSRISFFTKETQNALTDYLAYFNNGSGLETLFGQSHLTRAFRDSPIKVKDLRKAFSQTWDRLGGPTSIKKMIMGHSLKGDVDLAHYNAQSVEDLQKIYMSVMGKFGNV